MRPWHRVITSALVAGLVTGLAGAASAQLYDEARRALDFGPDPLARSARLLGMGRMTLIGDDPHNLITLWDFAGNPVGVASDDTSSTFELRPGSATHSAVSDPLPGSSYERQTLAGSEYHVGYEGWRRTREGTAYGAVGDVGMLRMDQPFTETTEQRSSLTDPNIQAVITGRVPWVLKGPRWRYALRGIVTNETSVAEYRDFVSNPTGTYLDRNGTILDPPVFLVPNQYDVVGVGGGAVLAYNLGPALQAALGGDFLSLNLEGSNDGKRYNAATHERRPLVQGQASVVGRALGHLEWGADGRMWSTTSDPTWDFSISAGIGQDPLVGRGKLLHREEYGTALRTRARWVQGPLEIGAGTSTGYDKVTVIAPDASDLSSFNYFLNTVTLRPNADSLALPDSVVDNVGESRNWDVGGGIGLRLPGRGGMVGAEVHAGREDFNQTVSGDGPRRKYYEVRGGLEVALTSALQARTGWFYRSDDRDVFTYGNKYAGNGLTLGLGLRPGHSVWSFDAGYLVYWYRIVDGDPMQPRGSRQQLLGQIRWAL